MATIIDHTRTWPRVKLGDQVDLLTGFPFKSANYTEDDTGIRLLRGDNVAQGYLRWDGVKRWPINESARFAEFELREGDVILSMDRPWIEAGLKYARIKTSDLPALLVQRVARLRGRCNLSSEYLLYVIGSSDFTNYVKFITTGTAVPHISAADIAAYEFPLPPLSTQLKIADILSTWDSAIDLTTQLITKKRDIKQATMQQLLTGKTRLPGFGGKLKSGYKRTEVGVIPEDWEIENLGDCLLGAPQYGINAPAVQYMDGLPIYIRITDITEDGRFSPENLASVRHVGADRYILQAGDLVFARTGASVGKTYLCKPEDGNLVFAGYLIRVKVNPSKLLPGYLAAYVKTRNYWNWVRVMSMRSGQPGINGNEYAQLPIPLPLLPEQQAITAILTDMDAEIVALEQKRDKTRALKQGMMQELLTGKTRLI